MTENEALQERLAAHEASVEQLEATMATVTNRDVPLLKGTLRTILGAEMETLGDLVGASRQFREDWAAREERLRALMTYSSVCNSFRPASQSEA